MSQKKAKSKPGEAAHEMRKKVNKKNARWMIQSACDPRRGLAHLSHPSHQSLLA